MRLSYLLNGLLNRPWIENDRFPARVELIESHLQPNAAMSRALATNPGADCSVGVGCADTRSKEGLPPAGQSWTRDRSSKLLSRVPFCKNVLAEVSQDRVGSLCRRLEKALLLTTVASPRNQRCQHPPVPRIGGCFAAGCQGQGAAKVALHGGEAVAFVGDVLLDGKPPSTTRGRAIVAGCPHVRRSTYGSAVPSRP